ncbi:hypothetical protein NSA50_13250 [Clostridium sp. DSM 100503]|uniref:hypothetical protein n=1 Tax=Clostridium sp. DSM 100503 TaxID=2963282 RepID=UPI002149FD77|nr:hypothetical protein [Clostridium sp. DSM 100503]MCR1952010.1 hypothetical protein [Clostridium sp. DSM 100503]
MAYNRIRECVTILDKLRDLLNTRNYLEDRIEGLESDININYIRLQQVNETIEILKEKLIQEQQEV